MTLQHSPSMGGGQACLPVGRGGGGPHESPHLHPPPQGGRKLLQLFSAHS